MAGEKFTPAQAEELAAAFAAAKARSVLADARFPVASIEDIIASQRAPGREKDLSDIRRLKQFREFMRERQP
jgi:hypothetical protein